MCPQRRMPPSLMLIIRSLSWWWRSIQVFRKGITAAWWRVNLSSEFYSQRTFPLVQVKATCKKAWCLQSQSRQANLGHSASWRGSFAGLFFPKVVENSASLVGKTPKLKETTLFFSARVHVVTLKREFWGARTPLRHLCHLYHLRYPVIAFHSITWKLPRALCSPGSILCRVHIFRICACVF